MSRQTREKDDASLREFLEWLALRRELTESTTEYNRYAVNSFLNFLHVHRRKAVRDVVEDDWFLFKRWLRNEIKAGEFSPTTVNKYLSAVRRFLHYLSTVKKTIRYDPATKDLSGGLGERTRTAHYEPKRPVPSFEEYIAVRDHLLEAERQRTRKLRKPTGFITPLKTLLAIQMMGSAGFRIGELVQLTYEMVNLETGTVYLDGIRDVHTKFEKSRETRISPYAIALLKRVMGTQPVNTLIFPWTDEGVRQGIKRAFRQAGIKPYCPHALRRFFAHSQFLRNSETGRQFDILGVQRALGHESVDTSLIYTMETNKAIQTDDQLREIVIGDAELPPNPSLGIQMLAKETKC